MPCFTRQGWVITFLVLSVACYLLSSRYYSNVPWKVYYPPTPFTNVSITLASTDVPIPFYMYSGPDWEIFTQCNTSKADFKHTGEPRLTRTLESHPWRVANASQAMIVVVPLWLGHAMDGACSLKSWEYIAKASELLRKSVVYQKYEGEDHLIYIPGWVVATSGWRDGSNTPDPFEAFRRFTYGTSESLPQSDRSRGYCAFVTTEPRQYVDVPFDDKEAALRQQTAQEYVASRPSNLAFIGQADSRHAYADRKFAIENLAGKFSPSYLIETPPPDKYQKSDRIPCDEEKNITENCKDIFLGPQDLTAWRLGRTKFGLYFRGDTPASQRLSDVGRVGQIQILISDVTWDQGLPFHCQIPWDRILYRASVADFRRDPVGTINRFMNETKDKFSARLALYQHHIPDFVWEVPNSRVAENILRAGVQRCQTNEILASKGLSKDGMGCAEGFWPFSMG